MKAVYPVIFTGLGDGYMAYAPDFEINTQGEDLMEAIGLMGIDMQDKGEALPEASSIGDVQEQLPEDGVISLVDIDFAEYRRKNDLRTVRRNVTLPSRLNEAANQASMFRPFYKRL